MRVREIQSDLPQRSTQPILPDFVRPRTPSLKNSDDDPYVSLGNGELLARSVSVPLTFIPRSGHFNATRLIGSAKIWTFSIAVPRLSYATLCRKLLNFRSNFTALAPVFLKPEISYQPIKEFQSYSRLEAHHPSLRTAPALSFSSLFARLKSNPVLRPYP
jgi:hypothetical protein